MECVCCAFISNSDLRVLLKTTVVLFQNCAFYDNEIGLDKFLGK